MLKGKFEIINNKIIHHPFPKEKIGNAAYCQYFQINISEVKIISISSRLLLGDEMIYLSFIDKYGALYPTLGYYYTCDGIEEIEKLFSLQSVHKIWGNFEYNDHYGSIDKIIYPKNLYWKNLYKRDWKWRWRCLFTGFGLSKSLYGNFTEEAKKQLTQ